MSEKITYVLKSINTKRNTSSIDWTCQTQQHMCYYQSKRKGIPPTLIRTCQIQQHMCYDQSKRKGIPPTLIGHARKKQHMCYDQSKRKGIPPALIGHVRQNNICDFINQNEKETVKLKTDNIENIGYSQIVVIYSIY